MAFSLNYTIIAEAAVINVLIWTLIVGVYRRYFHPLANIPGPFWASITHWYIVKQNLFSGRSQFYLKIEKLHKQYGPIIRISPTEIHLSNPSNYEKIYYIGSKAPSKSPYFYNSFGTKTAAFATLPNELHRVRRAAMNPVFARKTILDEVEDIVQAKTAKLVGRMRKEFEKGEGRDVDMHHGYRALAVDVITDYAFDDDYRQLDDPGFGIAFYDMMDNLIPRMWVLQAFPWLLSVGDRVTIGMAKAMSRPLYEAMLLKERCVAHILKIKSQIASSKELEKEELPTTTSRRTILHQLLDPTASEGHVVPGLEDLTDEMFTILTAAAETTGHAMTMITYYVLSNQPVYSKLCTELRAAFPSFSPSQQLPYLELENLPYLTAIIKEGIRLSYGAPGRLPRVVETETGLVLAEGVTVPKGTEVSMSLWMQHRNPLVWSSPEVFLPERWLDEEAVKSIEGRWYVPFGRGSRQCVGMHLANMELYVAIATIFRTFDDAGAGGLEISNGFGAEDLEFDDYFGMYFPPTQKKLRVRRSD